MEHLTTADLDNALDQWADVLGETGDIARTVKAAKAEITITSTSHPARSRVPGPLEAIYLDGVLPVAHGAIRVLNGTEYPNW